ncbi:tyrosine kinase, putative, partial [Entamoeba invadens IP1]
MFIILCVVSLTLARLVQVDFSSVNETLSDFFIYIGYNEYNEQRRNLPVFFKRDDKSYLTFESSLSIVQNRTFIFNVSEVKRVQIIDMRETVWLLHDKELRLIDIVSDPPAVTLDSVLDGQFDELAPMTFHHYTVDNTKEFDTLFTCLNGKLAGIKIETLTQKIQTNYKCGTYLNAGSSFIAMKRQKEVEVYRYYLTEDEYYSYGHVELYKNISVPDAYHSETFIYDPIKITRDDSVYVPVSDENIVYVFDKKSNYETYSTLIVPFYRENEIDFLKPLDKTPFENIYSYGQIILFGTPGYSTDDLSYCGGAYVIFDAVLDSSEVVRFREILHLYGNHQNAYMGYSACLSKNSVWVGGLFGPHYNYLYDDQSYSIKKINQQYCKNSLCQCPNYLNYSKGICLHNSTDFADKDYIIIGSSAGGVLLLLILIVVVVIVAILIPKRKKSSKFRLKNYE